MKSSKKYYIAGASIFVGVLAYVIITSFTENRDKVDVEQSIASFNYAVGTQTVGSKYKFTDETMLVETANEIMGMGSNLLKFSMHPRYSTENYGLPHNENINSLTKLATLEPSMKHVLDMDFKFYHIWVYGFTQYTPEPPDQKDDTAQIKFIGGYPDSYRDALYDELYEFTVHLLTNYNDSDKVFYLGNWEGDWHLRPDYNKNNPADEKTLEGMIAWANVRQKAIDDAKRDTKHKNVEVYHYIEVNQVRIAMENPEVKVVANSIVNLVNPDYVSYSSYDATNPFKQEEILNSKLKEALDYLESHLSAKDNLPEGKRVWIGEYGNPSQIYDDETQNLRSIWTIKASLEWGTPFILYWELYNNEIKEDSGEHVGYWLIDDKGHKRPIWHTHNLFYKEARDYVKKYVKTNNTVPSFDEFRENAVNFKSLNP